MHRQPVQDSSETLPLCGAMSLLSLTFQDQVFTRRVISSKSCLTMLLLCPETMSRSVQRVYNQNNDPTLSALFLTTFDPESLPVRDMSSSLSPDEACVNSSITADEDERDEYHFDYMWILIASMVLLAYLLAAVILISPVIKRKREGKEATKKRFVTPLAIRNSHMDVEEPSGQMPV